MKRLLTMLALLFFAAASHAAELKPLEQGGFEKIKAERQGKPFILTLWGIHCPYCMEGLRHLSALKKNLPKTDLVVISTDTLEVKKSIASMLADAGLDQHDSWVFGEAAPERLRYEIDRKWRGELPRTYLFDADHRVRAVSGTLAKRDLDDWAVRNGVSR